MDSDLFQKFRKDRDKTAFAAVVNAYRPLVQSVCFRYLKDFHDVQDAIQETFIKLMHHADGIEGSVIAWLTRTAYSSSVDIIRRRASSRRRRENLGRMLSPAAAQIQHEAIRRCVQQAMLELDEQSRQLLVGRYFQKTPLRVLATRQNVDPGTVSRWTSAAVKRLADIIGEMGVDGIDSRALLDFFNESDSLQEARCGGGESLRFSPDWRSGETALHGLRQSAPPLLEGWTRPLRVGVVVSHSSTRVFMPSLGVYQKMNDQVNTIGHMGSHGLQIVGIIEDGTQEIGIIESTLRDYGLVGGLVRGDDEDALATLDVIILGLMLHIDYSVVKAIAGAVRRGVGLLNEYWTYQNFPASNHNHAQALMLADSPIHCYHHPISCAAEGPAVVHEEHHLLPGLKAGTKMTVNGCGPAYQVAPGARMCISKGFTVPPEKHGYSAYGHFPIPSYVVGSLGKGRVVVSNIFYHDRLAGYVNVPLSEYFMNLIKWLAEPRREQM